MTKRIIIILSVLMFICMFMGIFGFTYAYFSGRVAGNENAKDQVVETGTLSLHYTDGPEIKFDKAYPGDKIEKTFTVENTGTLDVSYSINLSNMINTIINKELEVGLECFDNEDYENGDLSSSFYKNSYYIPLSESASTIVLNNDVYIESGKKHICKFKIEFLNIDGIQNYNQGKHFSGKIYISAKEEYNWSCVEFDFDTYDYLSEYILLNNCVYSDDVRSRYVSRDSGIDFTKPSSDTNGKGLYLASNNINSGYDEKLIYYRGDVEDNYVVFKDYCWRIVTLGTSGITKVRYAGEVQISGNNHICPQKGTSTSLNNEKSVFNTTYTSENDLVYYNNSSTMSDIGEKLELWSGNNYTNTRYAFYRNANLDKNESGIYESFNRIVNRTSPLFSSTEYNYEDISIGLLTADEVVYAGGVYGSKNENYYLYTGDSYWTLTPASYDNNEAKVFTVNNDGSVGIERVDSNLGVYPVIIDHLRIDYGSGHYNDPYRVYTLSDM